MDSLSLYFNSYFSVNVSHLFWTALAYTLIAISCVSPVHEYSKRYSTSSKMFDSHSSTHSCTEHFIQRDAGLIPRQQLQMHVILHDVMPFPLATTAAAAAAAAPAAWLRTNFTAAIDVFCEISLICQQEAQMSPINRTTVYIISS